MVICQHCTTELPLSAFAPRRTGGTNTICRRCNKKLDSARANRNERRKAFADEFDAQYIERPRPVRYEREGHGNDCLTQRVEQGLARVYADTAWAGTDAEWVQICAQARKQALSLQVAR
jgi:hypothetical protein